MNSETINKSNRFDTWPENLKPYLSKNKPNPSALDFNQKWINSVMDKNTPIFDIGRNGFSPFYNGIEMNSIFSRGYNNYIPVNTNSFFDSRIRISIWKY